jgi:hypothetical protein
MENWLLLAKPLAANFSIFDSCFNKKSLQKRVIAVGRASAGT